MLKNRHLPKEVTESKEIQSMLDYHAHLPETFISKAKYTRPLLNYPDEEVTRLFSLK